MSEINDMMCDLKKHAKETMEHYANKSDWKPEDLEMAYTAMKMYDKACDIQMKEGIWDEMKGDFGNSGARYSYGMQMPRISYGYSRGVEPMWRDERYESRGYSCGRDDYSGHSVKDRMIWALEQQLDTAKTEYERDEVRKAIKQIEQMSR